MSTNDLIAIIDDDEDLRLALVGLVRSLGYEVTSHLSAESFLSSPDFKAAACVVTDITLPGASGVEIKKALVAGALPTPVIMITARADPAVQEEALAARPFSLLRKPFSASELVDCIRRALASGMAS